LHCSVVKQRAQYASAYLWYNTSHIMGLGVMPEGRELPGEVAGEFPYVSYNPCIFYRG